MRFDTSVPLKARKRLELANFRGVDLTSSPLQISTSRAAESYNLILENGINRKRPGWESLFDLGAQINGIFPYDEGDNKVLLVHAGSKLYRLSEDEGGSFSRTELCSWLNDNRSQCFHRDNKVFIVGAGEPAVYGMFDNTYEVKKISDIAYVPTTTININPFEEEGRASKDQVNLLTAWRKNKLELHDVDVDYGSNQEFKLDGRVNEDYDMEITVADVGSMKKNVLGGYSLNGSYVGVTVENDEKDDGTATITFSFSPGVWSEVRGRTVTVKFYASAESPHSYAQRILNCRFGIMFGVDGKSNRLFLSGNPAYPNRDWWSEQDDFTYFPDGNTMEVGSSGSAITGYARLSDSTMAVFKDGAVGDATIYYRTGKTVTVTDNTDFSHEEAIFPAVAGTAGEALLTPFGVANLSGDVLMLGREGVYGIELSQNVASVERYTRERSRAIYGDLRHRSFTDAAMAVHKGRLYMAPHDGSGICYVADARYRASFEGADAGYEWWVWDHIPARVFAVYQDKLLFGDDQGRVCVFQEGTFADRDAMTLGEGMVSGTAGVVTDREIIYDKTLSIKDGDRIVLNGDLFAMLFDEAAIADGKVQIPDDENVYLRMWEGMKVWVDNVGESGLDAHQAYLVKNLDIGNLIFSLVREDDSVVDLTAGGFRLSVALSGEECELRDVDKINNTFKLATVGGMPLTVIDYNGTAPTYLVGKLISHTPVVSMWLSGMYDLGTYMDRKTLLGLSVATANDCGTVSFGYETTKNEAGWKARGIKGLDFNNIDFNDFTFLAPFAGSVTKRQNVRNFNFIRFLYRSEGDEDCAVAGMTVLYKINQTNRGLF